MGLRYPKTLQFGQARLIQPKTLYFKYSSKGHRNSRGQVVHGFLLKAIPGTQAKQPVETNDRLKIFSTTTSK